MSHLHVKNNCDAEKFSMDANPYTLFQEWYDVAKEKENDAAAAALGTANASGIPSVRFVLMKKLFSRQGQVLGPAFYTNYSSVKGKDMAENPQAALTFYWPVTGKQVRFEGPVEKMSLEESMLYFQSRPRESQIASLVSQQSSKVSSRKEMEDLIEKAKEEDLRNGVDRPLTHPHWGGHIIRPKRIEFFIYENKHRLSDRFSFFNKGADEWLIERLWP
jgi:pyridoxamine 5'-phosphate oxidase